MTWPDLLGSLSWVKHLLRVSSLPIHLLVKPGSGHTSFPFDCAWRGTSPRAAFLTHAHGAKPTRRISDSNRASERKTSNLGSVFSVESAEQRSSKHFSIHIKAASISPKPAEITVCANGDT